MYMLGVQQMTKVKNKNDDLGDKYPTLGDLSNNFHKAEVKEFCKKYGITELVQNITKLQKLVKELK